MIKRTKKPTILLSCLLLFALCCGLIFRAPAPVAIADESSLTYTALDGADSGSESQTYEKLFDGSTGTKYCIYMNKNPYVVFKVSSSAIVSGYSFYTGNDTAAYSGRNPKSWVLYACNDYNETDKTGGWVELHNVANDDTMGATNQTAYPFSFENDMAYKYYKFVFLARRGLEEGEDMGGWKDINMQLSEITITAVAHPDHTFGDYAEALEPDCCHQGNYKHRKCTVCKRYEYIKDGMALTCAESEFEEKIVLSATGVHTYDYWRAAIDPTCKSNGLYPYRQCTGCKEYQYIPDLMVSPSDCDSRLSEAIITASILEINVALDPAAHNYGEWVSGGNGTHTKTCSRDGAHTVTENCHGGEATCTEKATCEDCGGKYGELKAHVYDQKSTDSKYLKTAATCEGKAVYYYSCACGAKGTETFESGNVLGHGYGEWVSNGNGTHTKTCSHDGAHTVTENCHGGEATCTEKATCDDCGGKYGELKAHVYDQKSTDSKYLKTDATCEGKAVYYYSCACGAKGTETFESGNPLNHSFTNYASDNNATCESDGTKTATCDRDGCNETDTAADVGSALGHDYGAWENEVPATCLAAGHYKRRQCGRCGEYEYIKNGATYTCARENAGDTEIAKTDHAIDKENGVPVPPAADAAGKTKHTYVCATEGCDHTETEAHVWSDTLCHGVTNNTYYHWKKCFECGYEDADNKTACNLKYENKDGELHVIYCKIGNVRHELGSSGAQATGRHDWSVTVFLQDKYDKGEGAFHDKQCKYCGAMKNDPVACKLSYGGNAAYHWLQCSEHNKQFEAAEHSLVTVWDEDAHWQTCTVCKKIIGIKEEHAFESETSKNCSDCGYKRFFNATINVSGYAIDGLMKDLTASGTADGGNVSLVCDGYEIFTNELKQIKFLRDSDLDARATFRAETTYYVTLYFESGSVWAADDLSMDSFKLPEGFKAVDYRAATARQADGSVCAQLELYVMFLALGGESNEKTVSELKIDLQNFAVGNTFGDVVLSASCKDLPEGKTFTFVDVSFSYLGSSAAKPSDLIKNDVLIGIYTTVIAPDGFNFFGITKEDIALKNGLGAVFMLPIALSDDSITAGGKAISLSISADWILKAHECTFASLPASLDSLSPDLSRRHTLFCPTCFKYRFENHAYASETERECTACGYRRSIELNEMRVTVTGYETDAPIKDLKAEYSGAYAGSQSVVGVVLTAASICNIETGIAVSKTARFLPTETYYLMLGFRVPVVFDASNCLYKNVYVNGVKTEVFMADEDRGEASVYDLCYILALAPLTGEGKQTKVSSFELSVSGFTAGGKLSGAAIAFPAEMAGFSGEPKWRVTCDGSVMGGENVFTLGYKYVLTVELEIADMFYGRGVLPSDVKIGGFKCLSVTAFDLGTTDSKRLLVCEYLVELGAPQDHVHAYPEASAENAQYDFDENYHYALCGCGKRGESVAHTYKGTSFSDENTFVCSECGYIRCITVNKIEIVVSEYYSGMRIYDFYNAIRMYVNGVEIELSGSRLGAITPMPIGICAGVHGDFNELIKNMNEMPDNFFAADTDYAFALLFAFVPECLDSASLTKQTIVIKGLGETEIPASLAANYAFMEMQALGVSFQLPKLELMHVHGGAWVNGNPATCTENGEIGHYVCTICGKNFSADHAEIENLTIPALDHSFTNYASDNNATCESDGTKTATCDRENCNKTDTVADVGSARGHDYGEWVSGGNGAHTKTCSHDGAHTVTENCHGGEATCTEKATCEDCGGKYGELKAHVYDQKSTDSNYLKTAATCEGKAVYYYSCACGAKGTETFESGEVLNHSFTNYASDNNATCESDGTKTATCDRENCNETDTVADVGSVLGHSFTNYTSDDNATCESDGTKTATCDRENCNKTDTVADVGSALGHDYGAWVVDQKPTQKAEGHAYRECSHCKDREEKTIEKLPSESCKASYGASDAAIIVTLLAAAGYLALRKRRTK